MMPVRHLLLHTLNYIEDCRQQGALKASPSSTGLGWKLLSVLRFELEQGQQLKASVLCSCWGEHFRDSRSLESGWTMRFYYTTALAEFVVIPGNEFDKVVTEGNASPNIKGGSGYHRRQPDPLMPASLPSWCYCGGLSKNGSHGLLRSGTVWSRPCWKKYVTGGWALKLGPHCHLIHGYFSTPSLSLVVPSEA